MGRDFENDEELDAYVEGQDNGNAGPSKGDTGTLPAADKNVPIEYEYMARGKTIKEPLDQILKRASQGYDYAQLLNDFNKNKLDFDNRSKQFDSQFGHYTAIDKWAQQNPQQWQYIQQQYQSQFQGAQNQQRPQSNVDQFGQPVQQAQVDPRYQQLESKLSEHDKFIADRQAKESADKMAAEDEALKKDVESIRKEYSYLDFDTPDENGKSLYFKVLEHARDINTSNFRVAFRDFNHEKLLKLAEERGKETIAKDTVKKTKLGLVNAGKGSPPPQRDFTPKEMRSMSYDDVDREARKSIGLT